MNEATVPGQKVGMGDSERVWRERGLRDAVLGGDQRAWRTWYDESFADVYAYILWRCAALRHDADELTQDVWLTAVRRVRDFDPARGSFVGWLKGIAAQHLRNHWRRARRRRAEPLTSHESISPNTDDRDAAMRIAAALAELEPRHEAVLRAKYLEQRSVNDIAEAWNESSKAIESLLTRARQAFRLAFERDASSQPEILP